MASIINVGGFLPFARFCFASIQTVAHQIQLNINFTASGDAEAQRSLGRVSAVPAAAV